MRENDEVFADSGKPVTRSGGVTRGTALKVGGLGLAGLAAAFLPGRAGAAVKKRAAGTCGSTPNTVCGQGNVKCDPNSNCACVTRFRKLYKAGSNGSTTVCAAGGCGDFYCQGLQFCPQGTECPPGTFCADPKSTGCTRPLCVPVCNNCNPVGGGVCNTGAA